MVSPSNTDNLYSYQFISLSFCIDLAKTSRTVLSKNEDSGH